MFVIAKTIITKLQNLPKWRDEASACTESMGSVRYGPEFEDLHHSNTQETTSSLHADNLFLEQNLEVKRLL